MKKLTHAIVAVAFLSLSVAAYADNESPTGAANEGGQKAEGLKQDIAKDKAGLEKTNEQIKDVNQKIQADKKAGDKDDLKKDREAKKELKEKRREERKDLHRDRKERREKHGDKH